MKMKLKELVSLINGYAFKSSNYCNNGIRVIRIANVQDGYISDESPCYYPIEYREQLGVVNLEENDLLMSLTGNVGRVALLDKEFLPAALNQRVECLRPYNPDIKEYLFYYFRSKVFVEQVTSATTGSAQQNLSIKWLESHQIPIYDKEIQDNIVNELKKLDNLIKNKKTQLLAMDELVKSRFIEMFEYEIFPIKTISEVCVLRSGTTFDKSLELESGEMLYCKVSDMNLAGNSKYMTVSKTYVSTEVGKKSAIPANSVIFPKRGGAIGTNKKRITLKATCVDLNTMGVTPNLEIDIQYLYQYFQNIDLGSLCDGSTIPQLNNKNIGPLKIKIPPISLQNEFSEFVKLIDKSKFIVQQQIKDLEELLDSKMDEYFR